MALKAKEEVGEVDRKNPEVAAVEEDKNIAVVEAEAVVVVGAV